MRAPVEQFHVEPSWQPVLRDLALNPKTIFTDPRINVWRSLADRENATLDVTPDGGGQPVRLHVKRYRQATPAINEAAGIALLNKHSIPTITLVAHGQSTDGRGFIITQNLEDYEPADKLVEKGLVFEAITRPVAELAAKLHTAGLHHRDLYLCHFFVRRDPLDVRLIDAARVKQLPRWPFRHRWIVKDLAQLWYSMGQLNLSQQEKFHLLDHYSWLCHLKDCSSLMKQIESKSNRIARHDQRLNRKQPNRNISIPAS